MKSNLSTLRACLLACAVFITIAAVAPAAAAQGAKQVPDEKELRIRLERLEKELAAEREALTNEADAHRKELAERKAERRKLAGQVLDGKMELERLKKRSAALGKEAQALEREAEDLRELVKQLLAGSKTAAERLDIHLREIPADQRDVAQIQQILENVPDQASDLEPGTFVRSFGLLTDVLDRAHQEATSIHVRRDRLHTAAGLLEEVKLLSVGHAAFAYQTAEGGRIGLALACPSDASGYRWSENLPESVARELQVAMQKTETGTLCSLQIPMDVTGRLRVDTLRHGETMVERLTSGGPVMIPLAAVAMLALLLIVERTFWLYLRNADKRSLTLRVLAACDEKKYEEAKRLLGGVNGVVPRTLAACLGRRDQGVRAMEDGVQEQLLHELPRLRRFLAGLAILAAVAPLLGLLGTVTGIIRTFGVIRAFGNANPSFMAGGISEALITTATGLVIAIPILLCRGVLRGRMERILGDAERHAATLLNTLSRNG